MYAENALLDTQADNYINSNYVDHCYSTFSFRVPPDIIPLQLCTPPPKLLVYNSSYTQSIIYV
jgi:hypothetical protein